MLERSSNSPRENESNESKSRSLNSSTDTCSTKVLNPIVRNKKLNWVVNMIVETIEETVECEPVTIKLKKPKVRQPACR